jgi:hypothetical protein
LGGGGPRGRAERRRGRSESLLTGNAATVAALRGRFDEAVAGYERAIGLCTESDLLRDAEIFRAHMAAVEHRRGNVEEAATLLEGVVQRLAAVPGVSLAPRIQHIATLAELGRADVAMFDALATEARSQPSLLRALELYRLLQPRDDAAIVRALAQPGAARWRSAPPVPSSRAWRRHRLVDRGDQRTRSSAARTAAL